VRAAANRESVQFRPGVFSSRYVGQLVAGLRGVALDIAWDPGVFQVVDVEVTTDLPLFRSGELDNQAGTIDNLAGAAFLSSGDGRAIGNAKAERFTLLHFQAIQPSDGSPFAMRQGLSSIVTVPVLGLEEVDIYFEQTTITVASGFIGPLTAEDYFQVEPIVQSDEPAVSDDSCWANNTPTDAASHDG